VTGYEGACTCIYEPMGEADLSRIFQKSKPCRKKVLSECGIWLCF
jgi:hypothetical protein